jgi:hypothetical protein
MAHIQPLFNDRHETKKNLGVKYDTISAIGSLCLGHNMNTQNPRALQHVRPYLHTLPMYALPISVLRMVRDIPENP